MNKRTGLAALLCGVLLLEPLFSGGKIMFHAHGGTLPLCVNECAYFLP